MLSITKLEEQFYFKIGELFYAITAADGTTRKEEVQSLRNILKQDQSELKFMNNDSAEESTTLIIKGFKNAEAEALDASYYFTGFSNFKKTHPEFFGKEKNQAIWNIAVQLANSFAGGNKSELIMLNKLKLLFQNV